MVAISLTDIGDRDLKILLVLIGFYLRNHKFQTVSCGGAYMSSGRIRDTSTDNLLRFATDYKTW